MPEVILKDVSKIYEGGVKAVNNASFNINSGEFVILVGPSGCGKSTLLRMIAGLESVTEGEIYIDGKLVNNIPPKDRDIAMVFQNYALYPHMTVYENMAFGLKLRKFSKAEIDSRVKSAAEILELTNYLERKPKALSGGQRQRVAVGRAIVRNPKVFLFDEPLSNLDAKLRVQMRTEISRLQPKLSATMIYVTHDQIEAMTMGDKIVVLNGGNVQQIDSPLNLYSKPTNKFVAGFIGSPAMNFINGNVIKENGFKFIPKNNGIKFLIPKKFDDALYKSKSEKIGLGIRPEYFSICEKDEIGQTIIEVKIDLIEPLGNETFLYFQIDNENFIARVNNNIAIKKNEKISIGFNPKNIHLFDVIDGKSIL